MIVSNFTFRYFPTISHLYQPPRLNFRCLAILYTILIDSAEPGHASN